MIDRDTVDRILAAANIVDVISDFVTLKNVAPTIWPAVLFTMKRHHPSLSLQPKGSSNVSVVARGATRLPLSWSTKT